MKFGKVVAAADAAATAAPDAAAAKWAIADLGPQPAAPGDDLASGGRQAPPLGLLRRVRPIGLPRECAPWDQDARARERRLDSAARMHASLDRAYELFSAINGLTRAPVPGSPAHRYKQLKQSLRRIVEASDRSQGALSCAPAPAPVAIARSQATRNGLTAGAGEPTGLAAGKVEAAGVKVAVPLHVGPNGLLGAPEQRPRNGLASASSVLDVEVR